MKKNFLLLAGITVLSQPAAAMFCPSGFNQIDLGDTVEQVIRQCGKPDSQTQEKSDKNAPQQWQYYVRPDPTNPATLNVTIAFTGGKVINITANGTSLITTPICAGNSVSQGDSPEKVKAACGEPAYISKGTQSSGTEIIIDTLKYNTAPPVTFTFENHKLKQRN